MDFPLLEFIGQRTARGLVRGKVYMASRAGYTIVGGREAQGFSVMLLRGSDTIYHEETTHPGHAALKMLEVWDMLCRKLAAQTPQKPYRRVIR